MMRILTIALILFASIFASCDYSERDITDPRLPRYTEHGANIAGCIINEKVWFDPCYFGFFNIYTTCDGLTVAYDTTLNYTEMRFRGGYYTSGFEELEMVNLVFTLPGKEITNVYGLLTLIRSELPIDGSSVSADLNSNGESILKCGESGYSQNGKIFFRSSGSNQKAFAGTFGFSTSSDCGKYDVFHGRFDYDVARVDFISLN